MNTTIKNLPVIPFDKIAEYDGHFRVAFYAVECQMDVLFANYKIICRQQQVKSVDEMLAIYKPYRPEGLEVEGVTKLVVAISFEASLNNTLYAESLSYWVLFNDQLLRPYRSKNKEPFSFLLPMEYKYNEPTRYFEYEVEAPQRVSKATAKKMQAWADYLNAQEQAKQEYIANAHKVKDDFINRLKTSGLEYRRDGSKFTIYNGVLKVEAEIGETGIYCSTPSFNPPGTKSEYYKLGGTLDFMLNNDFKAIPK